MGQSSKVFIRIFRSIGILLSFLIVSVNIVGCSSSPKQKIEATVVEKLPTILGPADSYKAKAYGTSIKLAKGKLSGLEISGINVKLKTGVTLARLDVCMKDILFDRNKQTIKSIGSAEFSAVISETELNRIARARYAIIPDLLLDLEPKSLTICARPEIYNVGIGIRAEVGLAIRNNSLIALDLKSFKVGSISAPHFAIDWLSKHIDIVFDSRDLGFDVNIKSLEIQKDGLVLFGDIDVMKMINEGEIQFDNRKTDAVDADK